MSADGMMSAAMHADDVEGLTIGHRPAYDRIIGAPVQSVGPEVLVESSPDECTRGVRVFPANRCRIVTTGHNLITMLGRLAKALISFGAAPSGACSATG